MVRIAHRDSGITVGHLGICRNTDRDMFLPQHFVGTSDAKTAWYVAFFMFWWLPSESFRGDALDDGGARDGLQTQCLNENVSEGEIRPRRYIQCSCTCPSSRSQSQPTRSCT